MNREPVQHTQWVSSSILDSQESEKMIGVEVKLGLLLLGVEGVGIRRTVDVSLVQDASPELDPAVLQAVVSLFVESWK